jgi:hypothetical protein
MYSLLLFKAVKSVNKYFMLTKLNFTIPLELLPDAVEQTNIHENRVTINQPTGNFFYDPWVIKPEFEGTIWNKILASLTMPIGEARIIVLAPTSSYNIHADIDDRYHLNIKSETCFLIDLENLEMHKITPDGIWYEMNAGKLHTASNFGKDYRIQLVVRKLLPRNKLMDPVKVKLSSSGLSKDDARYVFDNTLSGWLNHAIKRSVIDDFAFSTNQVLCDIERSVLDELRSEMPNNFQVEILND